MNVLLSLAIALTSPLDTATFAGGCFWSMERAFDQVPGVVAVTVGYAGGRLPHPSYDQVSTGRTGHLESVQVVYDANRISYARLVDAFWHDIDPTQADGQFCDHGPEYHTAVFYRDSAEHRVAEASLRALERRFGKPITTALLRATTFYRAEEYHQHYYKKNPVNYGLYRVACGRDRRLKESWGKDEVSMYETKASDTELRRTLTPLQYEVTQHAATEPPFRNEQQPGDFHARDPAVHDHEIAVRQLGHERCEDVLQAEAPPEIWMIDAVLHHGVQVDELGLERRELDGELGHRLLQLADAGLLERRVHHHALGVGGGAHHRRRQRRARVLRSLGQERGVRVAAVRLPLVVAELGGGLLPRGHAGPHGNRASDRLEVEEAEPPGDDQGLQLARERWLDNDPLLGHRLELAPLGEVEPLPRRQVGDGRDAARQVGRGALWPHAGEVPDVVRRIGPAAGNERALVMLEGVRAHRDIGERPREHLPLPINFVRDSRKKLYDRSGDVGPDEQVARSGMPELLVQVQHGSGRDPHVAGRRHPGLDRDVRDVLLFQRAGRLHLGEVVSVALHLEHVDRDVGVVGDKRRLEDRRGARVE